MAFDAEASRKDYETGTAGKADKLVRKYVNKAGKLEASRSPEAQANWIAGVTAPEAAERRLKNLGKLSESDLNARMQSKGASNYRTGTKAASGDWAKGFTPYGQAQDAALATIPARTRDGMTNLLQRSGHMLKAMEEKKKEIG